MSVPGPLAGVTVIDLTRVLAGPYCTMVLCDMGARVIKVEHPRGGDDSRGFGPFVNGRSAYFLSLNRGKESIALDLKAETDRAVFERLLERADVLVENFRPGAMARLGYDWEALRARFPRLIYAAASGFGQTGPRTDAPAYDMVVQAMGGVMSLTGHPGAPPTRVGVSVGDITAGLFTAIGVCAALYDRRNNGGRGRLVDVAMLDCQIAILENAIARYAATGEAPGPLGARHASITPFAAVAVADGHIVVAAGNERLFKALCAAIGADDLPGDPRFADNHERTHNADALYAALDDRMVRHDAAHWLEKLTAAGVPCGPINDVAAALSDPQVLARNMVVHSPTPGVGDLKMAGNPIKISGFPDPATRPPAPELDADRAAILKQLG